LQLNQIGQRADQVGNDVLSSSTRISLHTLLYQSRISFFNHVIGLATRSPFLHRHPSSVPHRSRSYIVTLS